MKQLSLEAFADACGGPGPLCLEVASTDTAVPQRQVLNQPFALVGRHAQADIHLDDARVSRRHALVHVIAGQVFCLDLGSRTGTHWDGGNGGHGWVSAQSPFRVGPFRLSLAHDSPSNPALASDGWDPWAKGSLTRYDLPCCTLNIANNGTTVCRWQMNRVLAVIGSSKVCKVRLRGPGVSRLHCALICTPSGVWMIDLHRTGGIRVNGTPVGHSLLEDGDLLQVGTYSIGLSYDSPHAHVPLDGVDLAAPGDGANRGTGFDLLPPGAGAEQARGLVPALPPHGGALSGETWNAELLSSVLRQFSETQRHMFDQSLVMMYQMFQAMHKEQLGSLRAEMERLDELNQELRTLLDYKVKGLTAQPLTANSSPPPGTNSVRLNGSPATAVGGPWAPAAPKSPPAAGPAATTAPQADSKQATGRTTSTNTNSPSPAAASAGDDLHVWLCQRMDAIHSERQGLLDRIMGALKR